MNSLTEWIVLNRQMLAVAIYVERKGGDYYKQLRVIARGDQFTERGYNGIRKILGELGGVKETSTISIKYAAGKLLEELWGVVISKLRYSIRVPFYFLLFFSPSICYHNKHAREFDGKNCSLGKTAGIYLSRF